jgi:fructose-1,6-bisphosphatase/inositol monophosphatase family enzyme
LVVNLATGTRYRAVRGGGATKDAVPISTAAPVGLEDALVVLNGHPPAHFGWRQYRALGATALDVCAVADGSVDATIDCTRDALGPWDYMGALLVLTEAGGVIVDADGRDLVTRDPQARRTPVSASGRRLLRQALTARGTG